MSRFDNILSRIEEAIAALALGAASLIVILGVVMRYVFNDPLGWTEEAAILLLMYSSFIGAVIALRHNEHVGIDILALAFEQRGKYVFAILNALLTVLYCVVIGVYAWLMIFTQNSLNAVTPALSLPVWLVRLAVPLGLTLMFLRALEILYRTTRGRQTFPEAERDEIDDVEVVE